MADLHVWHDKEAYWVIAESAADATAVWTECTGEFPEDYPDMQWHQLDDSSELSVWEDEPSCAGPCNCEDIAKAISFGRQAYDNLVECHRHTYLKMRINPPELPPLAKQQDGRGPNGHFKDCQIGHPRKTCREWARTNGRGVLCSTEF